MDVIEQVKQNNSNKQIVLDAVRQKGVALEWASRRFTR